MTRRTKTSPASTTGARGLRLLPAVLLLAAVVPATAMQPELTAEQEETARHVEGQLMSPCCFGGTIATHQSPVADQFRQEIRSMVADGRTEAQILEHYLGLYGERILAQPVARGFNLLAYWMPAVAFLCGTGLVTVWLLRRRSGKASESSVPGQARETNAAVRRLHDQFEKELAAFDA
jgi:cytochrome c-type biogenesis protein CcmH